jgi:pullulanase/glycogen debranching enzyme
VQVTKAPSFLNDITLYHNRGDANDCGWMEGQCAQMGDFFGLDDIMTEDPRVVQGWAETWAEWVVKYDLDGFRIDTAKHTNDKFFPQWWSKIRGDLVAAGKTDFTIYGEAWYNAVADLATYAQKAQLQSYLDFPMQTAISNYVRYANGATLHNVVRLDDMYNLTGFNDGVVRNAYNLTTFLGNHDMGRGNSMLGADPTEPDAIDRVNLANSILFLFRGSPVVYYGDEVGMISYGGDADARQDMMPTEVSLWQEQERIGAAPLGTNSALGMDELKNPVAQHIIKLQQLRKQHPALANGAVWIRDVKDRMASWSKFDAVARREYIVVTNSNEEPGEITVQTSTPGATFSPLLGQSGALTADAAGKLVVSMAGRSTLVLRAETALPTTTSAPSLRVKAKKEAESAIPMVFTSAYTGLDPISVTFVARKDADSPWFVLGTDDNADFRLPLNAQAWGGSKSLQIAAIAKTSDGKVAAGPVNTIVRANIK